LYISHTKQNENRLWTDKYQPKKATEVRLLESTSFIILTVFVMCKLFSYCNNFSQKFLQVCGNDESVKLLSNWLHSWQQRGHQVCTDTYSGDVCDRQDADYNCVQSESDSENNNEGASLKNVLLITGPTGV